MSKIKKLFEYLFHDRNKIKLFLLYKFSRLYSDEKFLKKLYRLRMGKELNLDNPQTFCEKLQWLKLYNRKPEYTTMVDKYAVKEYVANIIGEEYIIPTIGVWDRVEDIDWEALPNQFVLKCTHDSGGLVICKDKSTLDIKTAIGKLKKSMKRDYFYDNREWPYKNVNKRIIAEELIGSGNIDDYKFSCYDGKVTDVMICMDRESGDTKFYFFDPKWNLLKYNKRGMAAPDGFTVPAPKNIERMFEIAGQLSKGIPYLRVDLYNIDGKIYFGESTFFPQSGMDPNLLPETDILFGSRIKL